MYQNMELFGIKSGPGPKSRNIEQTLAWAIQTKGSVPSKMVLFRTVGRQKGDQKRGGQKGRPQAPKREANGAKRGAKSGQKRCQKRGRKKGRKKEAKMKNGSGTVGGSAAVWVALKLPL